MSLLRAVLFLTCLEGVRVIYGTHGRAGPLVFLALLDFNIQPVCILCVMILTQKLYAHQLPGRGVVGKGLQTDRSVLTKSDFGSNFQGLI